MIYEPHNQNALRRRALNRVEQISGHLLSRPVYAREDMAVTRTQPATGTSSFLHHHQNGPPTMMVPSPDHSPASAAVSLPSFRHFADIADQSNLQYMRAPSLGCEYVPVPIIRKEYSYVSPPESVAAPSPTPSRSVSPSMPQTVLPIRRAKKTSPSYRVEKKTKSAKRKDYSVTARAQECENNRRVDEAQRPYKESIQAPVNGYLMPDGNSNHVNANRLFPRFDRTHVPRESKRARSVTGSSDPNTRHNVAQTHLRAEKGGSRMVLQRLLVGGLGWR
ncbi:hypothetical protein KCU86_g12703, partial [Aureobasidium melanogenum]